ncbi:MAG: O-antigen ligase family protein [Campylobacterota bacterium]|nr:O-antigen ligase family protein [Campylobacterota bacterium]
MINRFNINFPTLIIILFLSHMTLSLFFASSYTTTRISINVALSFIVLYNLFYNFNLIKNTLLKFKILLILFLIPLFQSYYSPYINTALEFNQQVLISISYLLTIFIVLFIYFNNKHISVVKFIYTIVFINILIFSYLFLHFLATWDNGSLYKSLNIFFDNRRFLNQLQTIFIPVLLYAFFINGLKNIRYLVLFLLFINFYMLFFSGARGSLYSLFIASVIIYFSTTKDIKRQILQLFIIGVISYLIFYFINFILIDSSQQIFSNHLETFSSNGRKFIYTTILPYIFDLNHMFNSIGFASQDLAVTKHLHPHNLFLYIFLGFGTFGLILFTIISLYYLVKLWSIYKSKQTVKHTYLMFISISVVIHSQVSGLYITPLSTILLMYLFILLNNSYFKNIDRNNVDKRSNIYTKLFVYTIISLILILNFIYLKKAIEDKKRIAFTKEELLNKELYKQYSPGIVLLNNKIYD